MRTTQDPWWTHACATSKRLTQEAISLRPIEAADAGFLNTLYASTRLDELATTGWSDEECHRFLALQFDMQDRYYQQHYAQADFLLLSRGDRPIGRLYWLEQGDTACLIDMSLLPAERGHGLGGALIDMVIARAERAGQAIRLHVEPDNPALRLYRRFDFEPVDSNGVYIKMGRPGALDSITACGVCIMRSPIPTLERLRRDLGTTYMLAGSWAGEIPAELAAVTEGVAMDRHHCCYSAEFALPAGSRLAQSSCALRSGDEVWQPILLTPVGIDKAGRHRMQAVFHIALPVAPTDTASA